VIFIRLDFVRAGRIILSGYRESGENPELTRSGIGEQAWHSDTGIMPGSRHTRPNQQVHAPESEDLPETNCTFATRASFLPD